MRTLIIEDELLAQAKLETLLIKLDPRTEVVGKVGSVKDAIHWLNTNASPDVAFVDIQLSDNHSFEIFRAVPIKFPVVFTTAYDKYLLESFEFNSIDYLLKPITEEKLQRALDKIRNLEMHFLLGSLEKVMQAMNTVAPRKDRIVVKKGTEFLALPVDDIAFCFTDHKVVFVRNFEGQQFIADENLSELESQLNKETFFRVNRKYIANIKAIDRFKPDNGKIRIFLKPEVKEEVHVSKESAPSFRTWIGAS